VKQIFPPSITGKGAMGASGAEASVLDHAFGKSAPYTLGVEEEYMLLDPETWDLVQHIDSVLAAVQHGEHEERIHAELMQSVLEVTTPVCRTAGDVLHALAQLRGYVAEIARSEGCRYG
jgi:carboxylate-amine ligase